jgi:hypothetical protein
MRSLSLLLCHAGEKSAEICDQVAIHFNAQTENSAKTINIQEFLTRTDSTPKDIVSDTSSNDAIWLVISDEKLSAKHLRRFSEISSFNKIFQALPGVDDYSGLVAGIISEIESRTKIQQSQTEISHQIQYEEMPYDRIAENVAIGCRRHLIKKISRIVKNPKDETTPVKKIPVKNSKLLQALVGLMQPPKKGTPVSGMTDVGVCLSIARDAYMFPEHDDSSHIGGEGGNPTNYANANWESLFTLFYASFVRSGHAKSNLNIDKDTITIKFEGKTENNSCNSEESTTEDQDLDFFKAFDGLLAKANDESNFLRATKNMTSPDLTLILHGGKTAENNSVAESSK